jgi:hypothetical protein
VAALTGAALPGLILAAGFCRMLEHSTRNIQNQY